MIRNFGNRIPKSLLKGLQLPVVAAPMFLASSPKLVVSCCKSGIIGTFPALNQRTTEGYELWLNEVKQELAKEPNAAAFGVNLIVHKSNARLTQDLDVTVKNRVPLVITSLGAVKELVSSVHSYGGVVFHDVINVKHARKAVEAGVDGLILVSNGAGGHAGLLNPFAFVREVRSFFDGVILLAGCISTGFDVAAARAIGADLAYVGTRFLATPEAAIGDDYRQLILDSGSSDITYTAALSGVNGNFLTKSIIKAGLDPLNLQAKKEIDFGKELNASKAWKDIYSAGQGVGAITNVKKVGELIRDMKNEYNESISNLNSTQFPIAKL